MNSNNFNTVEQIYVVYITHYSGTLLPPNYIGSSNIYRINNGYRGSVFSKQYKSVWEKELINHPELFNTEIISTHHTRNEAYDKELKLHKMFNVVSNPLFINLSYAYNVLEPVKNKEYCFFYKKAAAINPNTNQIEMISSELKKELGWKSPIKNKATVLNPITGRYMHISIYDENYIAGKYEPVNKGNMKNKSVFINLLTNETETLTLDDNTINWTNYKHANSGMFHAKDKLGNIYWISNMDQRYISGELIHTSVGTHFTQKIAVCPHCNKSGGQGAIKRWHMDNCKLNPRNIVSNG